MRALAAAALLLLVAACAGEPQAPPRDAVVRVAEDEVKSLDPQKISDLTSLRVAADLYEGLTRYAADGTVEPGLASAWTTSADGLDWRFALRPALAFSDGTRIDATTVKASLDRLRTPATAAPNAGLFTMVAGVDAPDPATVVVRLTKPFPAIAELLAHPSAAVLPVTDAGKISSGAYRLASWELHSRMTLERNPRYWDAANVKAPRVVWLPIDDDQTALRRFRSGQADTVGDFPASQLGLLRERVGAAVRIAPYRGSYYWVFNTRRPPFDDARVRRALSMAVDREKIAQRLLGTGEIPAYSVVPEGLGGYVGVRPDWADWPMPRRIEEARRLLGAAGYGPDRPLRVEARFNSDADHRRIGIALASFWKPLGVELRLFNTEATLHFAALRAADFSLARSGWIGDISAAENFLAIYASDAGVLNYSGHANPAFDAALAAGLTEPDPARRNAKLAAAERLMLADMPVLPLYTYVSKNLVGPRVTGWRDNLANQHPSRTLGLAS
jgi:peptide/nickel transport system substrate-binding protein/oligopeptide transport system substrate-binding protein